MTNFQGELILKVAGTEFEVVEPLGYAGNQESWTIPAGFRTDLASIPLLARWMIPKISEKYAKSACLHDFAYRTNPEGMTRLNADRLFLRASLEDGTKTWRAFVMYLAVRWFGGKAWRAGHGGD